MKKKIITLLLALTPLFSISQKVFGHEEDYNPYSYLIVTIDNLKEYIDYCKTRNDTVVIGFEYILSGDEESDIMTSGVLMRMYNPKLVPSDEYKNFANVEPFTEENVWDYYVDLSKKEFYKWYYLDTTQKFEEPTYIKCFEITKKEPIEPTLEGFVKWMENEKK